MSFHHKLKDHRIGEVPNIYQVPSTSTDSQHPTPLTRKAA